MFQMAPIKKMSNCAHILMHTPRRPRGTPLSFFCLFYLSPGVSQSPKITNNNKKNATRELDRRWEMLYSRGGRYLMCLRVLWHKKNGVSNHTSPTCFSAGVYEHRTMARISICSRQMSSVFAEVVCVPNNDNLPVSSNSSQSSLSGLSGPRAAQSLSCH